MGQDHSEGSKEGVSDDKLGLLGTGELHTGWWEGEDVGQVEKKQMRLKILMRILEVIIIKIPTHTQIENIY